MPSGRPARRAGRARRAVTGRALVLGAMVIVLVVVLASPVHRYFASRHDLSQAATQLQRDRQAVAQLQGQQAKWSDPGYIEAQARARLQYAMPGDTVYVVVRPGQKNALAQGRPASGSQHDGSTWTTRLWGSVRRAGG